jgi:MFS family permease
MSPPCRPSRARFTLLGFLCALTFVLYVDRVCIAQAVKPMQEQFGLSNTQVGLVLMAFTLAYGLFETPAGRWGDRVGSRRVLTRIALWWSAFTALTGCVWAWRMSAADLGVCPQMVGFDSVALGFYALLAIRFLFGAGEAGALPNVARIVTRWYPAAERGRVQGLIQAGALIGGTAAPVAAAYLIRGLGWRGAFVVFGGLGAVWAAAFWRWFRDDPAEHPAVNPGELALIGGGRRGPTHEPIPWRLVLVNRSIWTLALITICSAFNSYLYFSWFPKYLQDGRGVGPVEAGWLASLVLAGAAAGTLSGGAVDDVLRRAGATHLRRRIASCAFVAAAGLVGLGVLCESPRAMAACASLSCLAALSTLPCWWSCAIEVSGRHVGALFGLMNGLGVFGAMGSQFFFGAFADWRAGQGYGGRAQWDPAFGVYVGVLLLAALCWAGYVSRPVEAVRVEEATRRA